MALSGKRLAAGGVRVAGIVGKDHVTRQAQMAGVAPPARVVLLVVLQQERRRRQRVELRPEHRDVRDALFLVDDQVLDDVQVLGLGLGAEGRRDPRGMCLRSSCGRGGRRSTSPTPGGRAAARGATPAVASPSGVTVTGSVTGAYSRPRVASTLYFPAGSVSVAGPAAWKYVISNGPDLAIEAVVGVAPGVVGRPAAAVLAGDREPRRHGAPEASVTVTPQRARRAEVAAATGRRDASRPRLPGS